jgi:hypothetical protein
MNGELRPLAISAKARPQRQCSVLAEALPGATLETIIAIVAPAGTLRWSSSSIEPFAPRSGRRNQTAFATTTTEVVPVSTADLAKTLTTDLPRWHTLIKAAGIEPQ